jgi:hypothetical protein
LWRIGKRVKARRKPTTPVARVTFYTSENNILVNMIIPLETFNNWLKKFPMIIPLETFNNY